MENEKSIWNKTIFSETPNKYDDNFQIMNMKQKIKKIKKTKVKKENYKNIELLENIYDKPPEMKEGFSTNPLDKNSAKNVNNKVKPARKNAQEFIDDPDFLGLPDKDFDGVDKPDKGNKIDMQHSFIDYINEIYEKIYSFNHSIASTIAKSLSSMSFAEDTMGELLRKGVNSRKVKQSVDNEKDILIIQKYVGFFESILVAFFATYNWFYIIFYYYTPEDNNKNRKNEDMTGHRIDTSRYSAYEIQNNMYGIPFLSMYYNFINYFFLYVVVFMEYLQTVLLDLFPKIAKRFLNLKGCFIIVFVLLIMFFYYFNSQFHRFIIAVLTGNVKNFTVGCMYMFLLIIYLFGNYNNGNFEKTPLHTTHRYLMFFISPLIGALIAFIRFIIIMLITVPVTGFMFVYYILSKSLFGILFAVSFVSYIGTFFKINKFIHDNNEPVPEKEDVYIEFITSIIDIYNIEPYDYEKIKKDINGLINITSLLENINNSSFSKFKELYETYQTSKLVEINNIDNIRKPKDSVKKSMIADTFIDNLKKYVNNTKNKDIINDVLSEKNFWDSIKNSIDKINSSESTKKYDENILYKGFIWSYIKHQDQDYIKNDMYSKLMKEVERIDIRKMLNDDNMKTFIKIFAMFKRSEPTESNINEFITNIKKDITIDNIETDYLSKVTEKQFINKVKSSYNYISDFLYKYIIFIAYIFMLINAIMDYYYNISNYKLKMHLIVLSAVFICMMFSCMFAMSYFKDTSYPKPTKPVDT
jgi:hypothetical protein